MAIDFKTFWSIAPVIAAARHPIMIRGGHGKGKSQVVYQMEPVLKKHDGISRIVVERRASQMTEGDLLGLPDPDGMKINGVKTTSFCPPDWFVQACTEPCILFLDEVDRATLEVRQGIFELCDSRKIAGYYLHEDTVIFAAVNGGEHDSAAQYQVNEMDPAELDRWTVFDVEPSVEDWLAWAKDNADIGPIVWDFINTNRKHLEHEGEFEPNKVYPSRRSWHRLGNCFKTSGLLEENTAALSITHLASGFVGFEAAVSFRDFVENYAFQVSTKDILAGNFEKLENWELNQYLAIIEEICSSTEMKHPENLKDSEWDNVAALFKMMPSEASMVFWASLSGSVLKNTAEMAKFHGLVQEHLSEMLQNIDE